MDRNRQTMSRPGFSGIPRPGFSASNSGLTRQPSFGRGESAGAKARPNPVGSNYGNFGPRQAPGSGSSRYSIYNRPSTNSVQQGWSAAKSTMSSARKSYANRGQGIGLFGAQTPQTTRQSMGGGTASSRRSSLGGQARKLQLDPKMFDIETQKHSLRKINEFLPSIGLPKLNSSFTTSEVKSMFKAILNEFGLLNDPVETKQTMLKPPAAKISSDKWADDIVTFLPRLGYPYALQKSNLTSFASGSRAKAPIIAALEFVTDILKYSMTMDPTKIVFSTFDGDLDLEPAMKSELINSKLLQMAIFTDTEDPEARARALEELSNNQFADERVLEHLREVEEKLINDIKEIKQEIKEIEELPEAFEIYKKEISKYETYVMDMRGRIESVEAAIKQIDEEIQTREEQLEALKVKEQQLKDLIRLQLTDAETIEMARERQKQLEEDIKAEELMVEKKKSEKLKAASKLSMTVDTLKRMQEDAISLFDQVADGISMRATAQYLQPLIEFVSSRETQALINSLKVRPDPESGRGLDEICKNIRFKFGELANHIKSDLKKQSAAIDGEIKTKDDQLSEELDRLILEQKNRIQELTSLVEQLRSALSEQRLKDQLEIESLKSEYENNKMYLAQLDSKLKQNLDEIYQRITKLEKEFSEKVEELTSYKKTKLEDFKTWAMKQKKAASDIDQHLANKVVSLTTYKENLESTINKQAPRIESLTVKIENYKNDRGDDGKKRK